MIKCIRLIAIWIFLLCNFSYCEQKSILYSVDKLTNDWLVGKDQRLIIMQKADASLKNNPNDLACILLKIQYFSVEFEKNELMKLIEKALEILKLARYSELKSSEYIKINNVVVNMHEGLSLELNSTMEALKKLNEEDEKVERIQALSRPLSPLSNVVIFKKLESLKLYNLYDDVTVQKIK